MSLISFAALNDDCISSILQYLPSAQLFACFSSLQLKNHALRRCASGVLKKSCSPLSAKFQDFTDFPEYPATLLLDCKNEIVAKAKRPDLLRDSPLAELVEKIDISLPQDARFGDKLDLLWELISQLVNINGVTLRLSKSKKSIPAASAYNIFQKFGSVFGDLLPTIRSFAAVGESTRPNDLIELLRRMTGLRSLDIPENSLRTAIVRAPERMAVLEEMNLRAKTLLENGRVAAMLNCACSCDYEKYLSKFQDLKTQHSVAEINRILSDRPGFMIGALPCLTKLSLSTEFYDLSVARCSPQNDAANFTEFHLTLRQDYDKDVDLVDFMRSIVQDFPDLQLLHISRMGVHDGAYNILELLEASPRACANLRTLVFSGVIADDDTYGFEPTTLFLRCIQRCPKLEDIVIESFEFAIGDLKRSDGQKNYDYDIATFLAELESHPSLRRMKARALLIRSAADYRSALPSNYEMFHLLEKPDKHEQDVFVLEPEEYWYPAKMLIFGIKEQSLRANASDKLYLYLDQVW